MTSTNTEITNLFDKMKTATGLGMDEVAMYYQKRIDDLLDSARSTTAINNEPASSTCSSSSFSSASSSSSASSVSVTSKKRSNDETIKLNHSPIQASTSPSSDLYLPKKPRTEDLNGASLLLYQRNEIEPVIQKRNDNNNKLSFHDASHASLGVTDPESTSKVSKFFDDKSKYIQ